MPPESSSDQSDDIQVRPATADDTPEIIDVCSRALGWTDPSFDRELFTWKHLSNAFGPALLLVATTPREIAAVRPFMRWRFDQNGETQRAARAVDTATDPRFQGRGLFRRLTENGLEQLKEDGTSFVFNTPNAKSLPGYLKMGWVDAGQIAIGVRVRSIGSLPRVFRSRVPAEKRSINTPHLGLPADIGIGELTSAGRSRDNSLRTDHDLKTLHWRYVQGPISYRFIPLRTSDSGVVLRLRKRGASRELVVAEIVGQCSADEIRSAITSAMKQSGADYCLTATTVPRSVTTSRLGPRLALRAVNSDPSPSRFGWNPGDIELF